MSERELRKAVKSLNTRMPKTSAAMVQRMNATKTRVESTKAPKSGSSKSITINSGI